MDLYLVPHHGNPDTSVPAFMAAIQPRVAIVNNGPNKGGYGDALKMLQHWPGIEDTWQLHRSDMPGAENSQDGLIANLEEDGHAFAIKVSVSEDGSFSVMNGRTGMTKRYTGIRHK